MSTSILGRATMLDVLRIAGLPGPTAQRFTRCPFHGDTKPSLHLVGPKGRETGYKCFACNKAGGIFDFLVEARIAADHAHAAQILEERMGESRAQSRVTASFIYDDGTQPVARVDRIEPGRDGRDKDFLPYVATNGGFADRPGLNGARLPLYRRGEVLEAARGAGTIFFVEGEGKADALRAALREAHSTAGVTTIANGASTPLRLDHVADVAGAKLVIVLPDSDAPGRAAAQMRAQRIAQAHPSLTVRIVDLYPERSDGVDVADWLAEGHRVSELRPLAAAAPVVRADTFRVNPAANALGVLTDDELLARSSEHVSWLVEGFLRESGIMLMSARPKTGKSELARNLAKAVATGTEFLGRRCRQGKVVWVGLEEPTAHLQERIEIMGLTGKGIQWVVQQPSGDEAAWLRAVAEEYRPDLIIVDTIARLLKIQDINHYSEVSRATQIMLDLRSEFGTAFCAIHHNNRGDSTLGSVQWDAFCDCIMLLTRAPEGERFVKTIQRSGTDLESVRLERDEETGEITIAETKMRSDQRAAEQKILRYAGTLGRPATREELARHSGRLNSIGRAAVDGLVTGGLLKSSGAGTRADPRLYTIVSDPAFSQASPSIPRGIYLGEDSDVFRRFRGNSDETPTLSEDSEHSDGLLEYANDVLGGAVPYS